MTPILDIDSFISKRMIVGGNKTNSAVSGTGKGSHPIADH